MKILAIETSNEWCSCALKIGQSIIERTENKPMKQAAVILSLVQALLSEADIKLKDLDAIAFGQGPGSFTGVRIAASVAQGLAFGAELKLIAVPSLMAMASQFNEAPIFVAIDARKAEVYSALYEPLESMPKLIGEMRVSPMSDLSLPREIRECIACGNGWELYKEHIPAKLQSQIVEFKPEVRANAKEVALLAEKLPPVLIEEALPLYIRNKVVD